MLRVGLLPRGVLLQLAKLVWWWSRRCTHMSWRWSHRPTHRSRHLSWWSHRSRHLSWWWNFLTSSSHPGRKINSSSSPYRGPHRWSPLAPILKWGRRRHTHSTGAAHMWIMTKRPRLIAPGRVALNSCEKRKSISRKIVNSGFHDKSIKFRSTI